MNNDHSLNPVDFTNLLISECTEDNGTKWCLMISVEQQNILKSELMKHKLHNKINNTIPIYLLQRAIKNATLILKCMELAHIPVAI